MKKPNLFIVGAPKCGTTSMHYYLSQHPEIFMSPKKEPYHFCTDFHKKIKEILGKNQEAFYEKSEKEYLALFKKARNEKIIGESTTSYLYSKAAVKEIRKFNPNAKIIIMLRDPVEFLYSYHNQGIVSGWEKETNFEKALAIEKQRSRGNKPSISLWIPFESYYRETARFTKYIQRYIKTFGRKNVHIILLDDLKTKPEETYRKTLRFLGVKNTEFLPEFKIKNKRKRFKGLRIMRRIQYPPMIITRILRKIIPWEYRVKYTEFIETIIHSFFTKENNERIKPETKKKLQQEYREEVEKLNKLLHENGYLPKEKNLVKMWGYPH